MKKLLWIGDAACGSGFGRATTHILQRLHKQYELSVLGINYRGDPHSEPYPVYPAWLGGDPLGIGRTKDLVEKVQPDVIVIQTNPWNVPLYTKEIKAILPQVPRIGIIAVEGKNCDAKPLQFLHHVIFWTEFGRQEALHGGLSIPSSVCPLGVDLEMYRPGDRARAREIVGLPGIPEDAFIVGNVNRNQNRKRIDLSLMYFAEWIKTRNIRDAYLYLHLLPGSTTRINCDQLAVYLGMQDRLILAEPKDTFMGTTEDYLVATYQSFDVQLTTALGEGWGLTTMEGAACGIPQIAGDYAAIGEWGRDGVMLVPATEEGVMPDVHNMIGGVPDRQATIEALDWFYTDHDARWRWGAAALAVVQRPEYRWAHVAQNFAMKIEEACLQLV